MLPIWLWGLATIHIVHGATKAELTTSEAIAAGKVPFYLWVPPQTRERFLEMCRNENASINEMLARWAELRFSSSGESSHIPMVLSVEKKDVVQTEGQLETPVTRAAQDTPVTLGSTQKTDAPVSHSDDDRAESPPSRRSRTHANPSSLTVLKDSEVLPNSGDSLMLRLSNADNQKLKKWAGHDRRLLLTWTTGSEKYADLAMNLGLSVRANAPDLGKKLVCVALDRAAYRRMQRNKFNAVLHAVPQDGPLLKDAIWKMRWLIMHTMAHLEIDALVIDSDIVVLRNPFLAIKQDADLEVMTDHFWPQKHLWQYWVRPEDNINTGFVFVKASIRVKQFLAEFLKEHAEPVIAGIPRHWMDQQVFNKFVIRRMLHSSSDEVHGIYGDQTFRNVRPHKKSKRPIRIRILDPVEVAHGMNYFWLRAHEPAGISPVVAHANGVDGKEYFLRDRGHWYIDDFHRRFGNDDFLTYEHPHGMSLDMDFKYLSSAMVVAAALHRRLVLPNTMNCQNCPAFNAYGVTPGSDKGCTFDYFAWSAAFLTHHGDAVAESGVKQHPDFQELRRTVIPPLSASQADVDSASVQNQLRIEVRERGRSERSPVAESNILRAPVVHVSQLLEVYQVVVAEGFMPWYVFQCRHHDWPLGWMACRDQRFVTFHGAFAKCAPSPEQPGCGYRGVTCCETFWGWAEKMEYFTGRPWNLPCNCGIAGCATEDTARVSQPNQVCCYHEENRASMNCDRRIRPENAPDMNAPEDTHSYTSTALTELADGRIGPDTFWRSCLLNRQLRFSDRKPEDLALQCHRLASRYLLLKQNIPVLAKWCRFAHALRRAPHGREMERAWHMRTTLSVDTAEADDTVLNRRKLEHDVAQLELIPSLATDGHNDASFWAQAHSDGLRSGAAASEDAQLSGIYNRALHIPSCTERPPLHQQRLISNLGPPLTQSAFAMVDDVLPAQEIAELARWLKQATVWHTALSDGNILQASLFDGLHCESILALGQELSTALTKIVGTSIVLEDMWAWKFGAGSSRSIFSSPQLRNADFVACLWIGPDKATTDSARRGLSLRSNTSSDREQIDSVEVSYQGNRLTIWSTALQAEWLLGAESNEYQLRRMDLVFAYREGVGHRIFPGLTRWSSSTSEMED